MCKHPCKQIGTVFHSETHSMLLTIFYKNVYLLEKIVPPSWNATLKTLFVFLTDENKVKGHRSVSIYVVQAVQKVMVVMKITAEKYEEQKIIPIDFQKGYTKAECNTTITNLSVTQFLNLICMPIYRQKMQNAKEVS